MTILVAIVLWGWIPTVLVIFAFFPPRRAVIMAFISAWLFLPIYEYELRGLPDYNKITATSVGVLFGILIFDTQRLFSLRGHWFDIPMLLWCFSPFASSVTNGLGIYDGASAVLSQFIIWGLPYLIGRIYFNTFMGLRELAIGIFIGGLIYVPLCLFEIRMSPQLHNMTYGFHQHQFAQSIRFGGYRPTVFMQHGLAVSMWMVTACIVGIWLNSTRALKSVGIFPTGPLLSLLLITTVLCKSLYSLVLLIVGLIVFLSLKLLRNGIVILGLVIFPSLYLGIRTANLWSGAGVVPLIEHYISPDRARSLQGRVDHEDILKEKAFQRLWFGWGGWGRNRVLDDEGKDRVKPDSMWIIVLGETGVFGLLSITLALLLPTVILWRNFRPGLWGGAMVAPAASLAVVVNLYMLDNLLNHMANPIYLLIVGGLTALTKVQIHYQIDPGRTLFDSNPWRSNDLPIYLHTV